MTTLIETVRVKGGKAPLWPYHLVRLSRSAKALRVTVPTLVAPAGGPDRVVRYAISSSGFTLEDRPIGSTAPVKLGLATKEYVAYPHKTDGRAQFEAGLLEAQSRGEEDLIFLSG